ncbi:HNH endonuclease [Rhodothermaceae bacterium RA]|nr:HNH endonuclease [Rhodothermaceae bacterium RA]
MPTPHSPHTPDAGDYLEALKQVGSRNHYISMLQAHYHAAERTITPKQMAHAVGYAHFGSANLHYGILARKVGDVLNYHPQPESLGTLVIFEKRQGEWHWIMRQEVAHALEMLGWVNPVTWSLPDEVDEASHLIEGAIRRISVNAYERNHEARRRCIDHYGTQCFICGFDFERTYGKVAKGYIHVHHLVPLSEIGESYNVDPLKDLRPVCPNCHAVIHLRQPPYTVEEVRAFIQAQNSSSITQPEF